jgi:hypothetical protein
LTQATGTNGFEPDRLPSAERFFLYDPFPGVTRTSEEPRSDLGNTELALKVSGSLSGWELALYAHRGYYRTPIMVPDATAVPPSLSMRYPRRNVYGGSVRGAALGGVVSLEAGYYDSPEDGSGTDPRPELPGSLPRRLPEAAHRGFHGRPPVLRRADSAV